MTGQTRCATVTFYDKLLECRIMRFVRALKALRGIRILTVHNRKTLSFRFVL